MFEVLTDSFAYLELYDGKLTNLNFQNKVMNEKYHPMFAFPVKETQKLTELCWSNNPGDRQTFEKIFEKLIEENYFLEDVDKVIIHFLRHMNEKSSHAVTTIITNSSAATQYTNVYSQIKTMISKSTAFCIAGCD